MAKAEWTIWWIKRDFRLSDNPALSRGLSHGGMVLPVFILEPSALSAPETSARHVDAQLQAFRYLRRELRRAGAEAVLLHGEVIALLTRLHDQIGFSNLVSHEEVGTQRTYQRDIAVNTWCKKNSVKWVEDRQTGVFRRLRDRNRRAELWSEWTAAGPLPAIPERQLSRVNVPESVMKLWPAPKRRYNACDYEVKDCSILPGGISRVMQPVSEIHAKRVLDEFLHRRAIDYAGGISSPNTAFRAGSRLSVHLAWGTITGRQVYHALQQRQAELADKTDVESKQFKKSLRAFQARLHWRDHFMQRLESAPDMENHSLNPAYDDLTFSDNRRHLHAWINGTTGFPFVDACLRCAAGSGFLNFRMRCLITSLACHSLRLDWRDILWPMAQWWTDYEPGIHVAQMQMQAGVVGINTLRVYSPAKQMLDQDPNAQFVKRWVPELATHTAEAIYQHHEEPLRDYPSPLVDWRESSKAMRGEYFAIKRLDTTQLMTKKVLAEHGSRKPTSTPRRKKAGATQKTRTKSKAKR